jgi:hypothetical protein
MTNDRSPYVDPTEKHVELSVLWAHRSMPQTIAKEDLRHIARCDKCLKLLDICQTSATLQEVEQRVSDSGDEA